ncbi:SOCS box domain-containing protein [Trichonephila clavipes]|nr:SOCS box domain-containing protein [Trichonephila clavipes]
MAFKFPEILPKLLRHGLFVMAGHKDENVSKLITGIIGIFASSGYETCPPQIIGMGNVLLRAVKSVDAGMLMRCQRVRNRSPSVQKVLAKVIETNILPKLRTGRPGFDARCQQIPSEYTRSTCSLNQWVRSLVGRVRSAGTGEYSPPLQFPSRNCGGGDRGGVAIYRTFGNFAKLNRTVTCMVLKANDRRTPSPMLRRISWASI